MHFLFLELQCAVVNADITINASNIYIHNFFFHAILSIYEAMAISLILYNIEMSFYVLKMK